MTGCRTMRDKRKVLDGKVPEQKGRLLRLFVFRSLPSSVMLSGMLTPWLALKEPSWAMRQCKTAREEHGSLIQLEPLSHLPVGIPFT